MSPTVPRITVADPRVAQLARSRQQLVHRSMLAPRWEELTDAERGTALLDARNWLQAAAEAGLLPAACTHPNATPTGVLANREFDDAQPAGNECVEPQGKGAVIVYAGRCPDCGHKVYTLALHDRGAPAADGDGIFTRVPWTAPHPPSQHAPRQLLDPRHSGRQAPPPPVPARPGTGPAAPPDTTGPPRRDPAEPTATTSSHLGVLSHAAPAGYGTVRRRPNRATGPLGA